MHARGRRHENKEENNSATMLHSLHETLHPEKKDSIRNRFRQSSHRVDFRPTTDFLFWVCASLTKLRAPGSKREQPHDTTSRRRLHERRGATDPKITAPSKLKKHRLFQEMVSKDCGEAASWQDAGRIRQVGLNEEPKTSRASESSFCASRAYRVAASIVRFDGSGVVKADKRLKKMLESPVLNPFESWAVSRAPVALMYSIRSGCKINPISIMAF
jgi:hypothetical protein